MPPASTIKIFQDHSEWGLVGLDVKCFPQCWRYMTLAVKILDRALRGDFGFSCLLWVYSGRRGVHLWVCDQQARRLNTAARGAVAEYLQLVQGGEHKTKKIQLKGGFSPHPSVSRAYSIVKEDFEKLCLIDQDILGNKEAWTKVNRYSILAHEVSVFLKGSGFDPGLRVKSCVREEDGVLQEQRRQVEYNLRHPQAIHR